jgi:hypothetical protein
MDLKELKSQAYDTLVQIEKLQQRMQILNQQIAREQSKPEVKEP